jgi:hypothetical protein
VTLHTDIPTRSAVEQLLTLRGEPCVSVYLATSPVTQEAQAARIELKNLTADAITQLEAIETGRGVVPELRVLAVRGQDVPGGEHLAAILRYAL